MPMHAKRWVVYAVLGVFISTLAIWNYLAANRSGRGGATSHIDGARAMQYTREIVAFGPRPLGSLGHQRVEGYLRAGLRDVQVEEDTFTATTPDGPFPVVNIIAKFPGMNDRVIVIISHYDTNYPLRHTSYVGANDGASSSALLLEIANELRRESKSGRRSGSSVWLVFTDAEEAIRDWSDTDGLYGSKHLAAKWQTDGTVAKLKAVLVADMVGYKDLQIERDANSTPWLEDLVYQAASNLGYQSEFFKGTSRNSQLSRRNGILDDHVPFERCGVSVADIIDLNYGPENSYHHTTQDTLDNLSAKSLETAGDVIVETVRLLDRK